MGKAIQQILKDPDRKSLFKIGTDLTRLLLKYKSRKKIGFYATQLMYKKDAGKIDDYASEHMLNKIKKKHLWKRVNPLIKNKLYFADFMRNHHYPVPQYWGKIENACFYDKENNKAPLRDRGQLKEVLKSILKKCPSIFIKPVGLSGGEGHQRIDLDSLEKAEGIDINEDYIIQETLIQHDYISSIYPNCINTIRVITYRKGDDVYFPSCHFLMGLGNTILSNNPDRSIGVTYDINTGELGNIGYTIFKNGGRYFREHPDTKFKFEGAKLLFSEEIKEMLSEVALLFDQEIIGWDIALTQEGPSILEGNCAPGLSTLQINNRGLKSNPMYCEIFQDYL